MTPRRYELSDFEWSMIQPLLAEQAARRCVQQRPQGLERHLLAAAHGLALVGNPGALRAAHDLQQSLPALAQTRCLGSHFRGYHRGL